MLNTFLIRHDSRHIQALDDLEIHYQRYPVLYRVGETVPAFTSLHMLKIHESVREVGPGFRMILQKVDDDIEALNMRREELLGAAFEDGLQLTVDQLADFVGDDDGDAID